jgi:molybdopterin synthase catalytic subunit
MRVRVLFFGRLKEIVGRAEDQAEMVEGARVEDLFARYGGEFPKLAEFRPSVVASVNQEFAAWHLQLHPGDEVAFLPPVSGGRQSHPESQARETAVAEDICELVRAPIRSNEIVAHLKAPEDGAVVVLDGIVRNHSLVPPASAGSIRRQTLYLEYEAYEPMALKKMREIGREVRQKFSIHRLALVHRLGRLEIGETSVLIAVSSPHRRAAFDACRYAIDALKRSVPIWKKEYLADGAVWAEGEIPTPSPSRKAGADESALASLSTPAESAS